MPAKRKEPKAEEPTFVDEEGAFVHEHEHAVYRGAIRRFTQPEAAAAAGASPGTSAPASARSATKTAADSATAAGADGQSQPTTAPVKRFRHGYGVYRSPTLCYTGNWVEDRMSGNGRLEFIDTGSVYDGTFVEGCFEGRGLYTWGSGERYDGWWRANRMHGNGVFTDADGNVWKGTFFNGTGPGLAKLMPIR